MSATPIASLVPCSWCGLLAEPGVICDACGSPVSETTGRTTVLRVPEASGERFREGLRDSSPGAAPPVAPPRRAAARWMNVDQASVMSGMPQQTLRGWALSRTPEDVPIREGDPRFLLIRTPGLKLPDGLWLVDGPKAKAAPTGAPVKAAPGRVAPEAPSVSAPAAPVARPDMAATAASAPVAPILPPPLPPKPQLEPAPIIAPATPAPAPVEEAHVPVAKAAPPVEPPASRRGPVLPDTYLEALLASDELLPVSWGFDSSPGERKIFRRHKILTTAGVVLGFAGVAELIDFLMSHLR